MSIPVPEPGTSDLPSRCRAQRSRSVVVDSFPGRLLSEDGLIAASVRSEGCVQVAESDNDVMSRKGGKDACDGVVEYIKFKTLVLVYKAINNMAPVYLQELLHPHVPCRGLRSSEKNLLVVPFTRSSAIQQCAFSAAGPRLWNSLPLSLRSAPRLSVFKAQLKTYLFEEYYG